MVYSTLPITYQNVIFEQHSYITKWFVFLFLILFSCYYLFVMWGKQQRTKFYTVFGTRLLFGAISVAYLFSSPFTLLLMSPELSFYDFYLFHLLIYKIVIFVIGVLFIIDFFRYGIIGILKLAGVDLGDSNSNELARALENNKHFMKLSKRGKK